MSSGTWAASRCTLNRFEITKKSFTAFLLRKVFACIQKIILSSGTWQDYFDVPLVIKFHNTGISSDKTRRKCWNYAKAIYLITICYIFAQNFKYLKFYNCKFYNGVCAGKNFKFLKLQAQIHASSGTWQDYFDVPLVIKFGNIGIFAKQAGTPAPLSRHNMPKWHNSE